MNTLIDLTQMENILNRVNDENGTVSEEDVTNMLDKVFGSVSE